jgi:hypothetical protein
VVAVGAGVVAEGAVVATVPPSQAPSSIAKIAANETVRIVIKVISFSAVDEDTPTPITVWNRLKRKGCPKVNLR